MKETQTKFQNPANEKLALVLPALLSLSLFCLTIADFIDVAAQIVIAPFLVAILLVYGDRLLIGFVLQPFFFLYKLSQKNKIR